MGKDFVFTLATAADDAEIRALLAAQALPGSVVLTYEREPDYFLGAQVLGDPCQVLVARYGPTGELAGILCRAVREYWVNGQVRRLAYLGQLRVAEQFQGRWLSTRSMPLLNELHQREPVAGYISSITRENRLARGILVERPRRSFPYFAPWTNLVTYAIHVRRGRTKAPHYTIKSEPNLAELIEFLWRVGSTKQLFPAYTQADWAERMRDLPASDIFVAEQNGQIVGSFAVWNQSAYKQTVVRAYGGALRWARPLYNLYERVRGGVALPEPGQQLTMRYASLVCIDAAHIAAFEDLLNRALEHCHAQNVAFLMLGLTQGDKRQNIIKRYGHITYESTLYTLRWPGEPAWYEDFDERPPAPELAFL